MNSKMIQKENNLEDEERRKQRLRDHLGLDEKAVEVVLHLRRQVLELRREMRELEIELNGHRRRREHRIARYHLYYEATWREVEPDEEKDRPPR